MKAFKRTKTRLALVLLAGHCWMLAQADTVYVSSVNGNKIYRIATNGAVTAFATINLLPEGLAFNTNGVLYVASSGAITKITPAGAASTFATGVGDSLVGLAFDNHGNLYAASYTSGVISKIAPDQTRTSFATVPGNPSFIAVYPPPKFDPGSVSITQIGDDVVVSWFGNFALQSAADIAGPYADVLAATSPYTNAITNAESGFFRLRN